jgi:hypothetical protein
MTPITSEIMTPAIGTYNLRVSRHAFQRAKERLHWNRQAITRMAYKAIEAGLVPSVCPAPLKLALNSKCDLNSSSCPFLYGENIYCFTYNASAKEIVLLTIYRAPRELLRLLVNKAQRLGANCSFGVN